MAISGVRRRPQPWGLTLGGGVALALVLALRATAQSPILLTDDFNDGNSTGWTKSGGSWSVVTDGSPAFRQTSTGSDAKAQAGSAWGDQAFQARVKPLAFSSGSGRLSGIIGRAQSMTNYYYLALGPAQVILGKRTSGGYVTLASAPATVSTGTWYTLRFEAFGGSLRGYLNGALAVTASDSAFATGKIGLTTYYSSASFDDLVVTDSPGPGPSISPSIPTSPSASTSPSTSPSAPASPSPSTSPTPPTPGLADGFASVNAWGQNGTTGGAGGSTVTVDTAAEFLSDIAQPGTLIIQVSGMITLPGPMHDVTSDKTIVGVGAELRPHRRRPQHRPADRRRHHLATGERGAERHHPQPVHHATARTTASTCRCSRTTSGSTTTTCPTQYDGALDIKRGSDYVTSRGTTSTTPTRTCCSATTTPTARRTSAG